MKGSDYVEISGTRENRVIEKPTIIVTSLGRTGTTFFSLLFRDVLNNCTSLHEPDYLTFKPNLAPHQRIKDVLIQIHEAGFRKVIINKLLGKRSLRHFSDKRVKGEIDRSVAASVILARREEFVCAQPGNCYVESSSAFYGLIDVLPRVFLNHRAVFIIRDGRDWVRSRINLGGPPTHDRQFFRRYFSPGWPTATDLENDPYQHMWGAMGQFERLCWVWARLNEYALKTVNENRWARVFRFEDLFKSEDKHQHFEELVRFATSIKDISTVRTEAIAAHINKKVHASKKGNFPQWSEWAPGRKQQFSEICGPLMESVGYKL